MTWLSAYSPYVAYCQYGQEPSDPLLDSFLGARHRLALVTSDDQETIDGRNAEFWNEMCGTTLARQLGISAITPASLRRFDGAYLERYPYLEKYMRPSELRGERVLEIGLGFGTIGQLLAERAADYHAVDIAKGPVEMMRYRLNLIGQGDKSNNARQGSVLDLPYESSEFDAIYAIGVLHHTGDLRRALSEVYRVLRPEGRAVIMLYYRYAIQRLALIAVLRVLDLLPGVGNSTADKLRYLYDRNTSHEAAPHTDFVSKEEVRTLMKQFSSVSIEVQNFQNIKLPTPNARPLIPRRLFLNNVARIVGQDLYIVGRK